MKKFRIKVVSSIVIMLLIISSCDKGNEKKNCGCDSETIFTIQDADEQRGYVYKTVPVVGDNVPSSDFTIMFSEPDCGNCKHFFLVCNDSFLSSLDDIPNYPGIEVKFSGHAMELCSKPIAPGDYTYNYITLTKVQSL